MFENNILGPGNLLWKKITRIAFYFTQAKITLYSLVIYYLEKSLTEY